MKKILLFIFCVILLVGTISAFNVKKFDDIIGDYGKVTIKERKWYDPFGWVFEKIIIEKEIVEHTPKCLVNCYSEGVSTLYRNMSLFDRFEFKNRKGEDISINYNIFIKQNVTNIQKITSNKNNKTITKKTIKIVEEKWIEYNYEVLNAGSYEWRIEGKKDPNEDVDWIGTTNGIRLTDWAWWEAFEGRFEIFNTTGIQYWTVPDSVTNISLLVVAGGGANLEGNRGGGGAGGVYFNNSYSITPLDNITVVVGNGMTLNIGTNGGNSSFEGVITIGGGAGGNAGNNGLPGGSGGGGGENKVGGVALQPSSASGGYGYAGGDGYSVGYVSGGGGGAGEVGKDGYSEHSGDGGDGIIIFGECWAGGGGAGSHDDYRGLGNTTCGGGAGTQSGNRGALAGINGSANTGGGGLNGGSGIVVVRYFLGEPSVSLNFPINTYNSTSLDITFNGTVTSPIGVINVSLVIDGSYIETNSSGINDTHYYFTKSLSERLYNWTYEACNIVGCINATTRTFSIDVTAPFLNLTAPSGLIGLATPTINETLYWNVSDDHLDSCWFNYNSTNTTVTCADNTTTFSLTSQRNLTFYANDTLGHLASNFTTWSYKVFFNEESFNNETIEGTTEIFILNVTIGGGVQLATTNLKYNDTDNFAALSTDAGGNRISTVSKIIPDVNTETNLSFYWSLTLDDSTNINTSSKNQTVKNLAIDDCSVHTNLIFNYTIVSEEAQEVLPNTTLEIDINIFSLDKSVSILNFSTLYDDENPATVCLNTDLTNSTNYLLDSIVRYEAINHTNEYYNLQSFTLENSTVPQHITLYDLLSEDSTEFQITFKDSDFAVVEDALIQINREYVAEGVFKTVEIPKTDSNGQAVGHLVEKEVIYNIIVVKNSVVLGTFDNVVAFCQDAFIGNCFITLNALKAGTIVFDYDDEVGLAFAFSYNESSRLLQFPFTTLDGSVKDVSLLATKLDQLGNTTACTESLTTSSGTLSCSVPDSIGNETIIVEIFVEGDLKITNYIQTGTPFDLGDVGYFLMFFLVLSLALMMTQSKIAVILGVVLGFISSILLSFMKGGILGYGSSIIWLVIMAVILIWRLNKEG